MVLVQRFFCIGLRLSSQILAWLDIITSILILILFGVIAVFYNPLLDHLAKIDEQEKEAFIHRFQSKLFSPVVTKNPTFCLQTYSLIILKS